MNTILQSKIANAKCNLALGCITVLLCIIAKYCLGLECDASGLNSVKFPLIWFTEYDRLVLPHIPKQLYHNYTIIDSAEIYNDTEIIICARFLKYSSTFKFSTDVEATLYKANITNGKVSWIKAINRNSAQGLYCRDLLVSQYVWINLRNISDSTYSSILKVNPTDGSLIKLTSFTCVNNGFQIGISKLQLINDTTMIAIGSGSHTQNNVGISNSSNSDIAIILIQNDSVVSSFMNLDYQNGDDYAARFIIDSSYIYFVGYSNFTNFILSRHDLNTLMIVDSTVFSITPSLSTIVVPTLNIWSVVNGNIFSSIYTTVEILTIMVHSDADLSYVRHFDFYWQRTAIYPIKEFSFGESYLYITSNNQVYVLMMSFALSIFKIDLSNLAAPLNQIRKYFVILNFGGGKWFS